MFWGEILDWREIPALAKSRKKKALKSIKAVAKEARKSHVRRRC
jgi:hypothetical protein